MKHQGWLLKPRLFVLALLSIMASDIFLAAQANKLSVVDATGRTVELVRLPQRLVVAGRGPFMVLHLLYTFAEGRQRLVGVENRGGTSASDFIPLVDPAFESKTILYQNPNAEQIASLNPDLVIMKGVTTDWLSESLQKVGIPTLYLALETPEQFAKDVTNLGLVLGNSKRAAEILAFYQPRLERLRKRTANLKEIEKPRVLLLEYSDRGGKLAVQVPRQIMDANHRSANCGRESGLASSSARERWIYDRQFRADRPMES